jgi:small subunit ribosomal protein S16
MGLKGQPSYRIVVADQRSARTGGFIESIGHHNPRTEPSTDVVNEERALYWLNVGAQPSSAVTTIFKRTGTMDRFARLKQGESLETLMQEATAARTAATPVSPKTSHPAPEAGQSTKKAKEVAAASAEDASAE